MTFVATASIERPLEKLQGDYVGRYNEEKLQTIEDVVIEISSDEDAIYLFPGGLLSAGGEPADTLFTDIGKRLGRLLENASPGSVIVLGIDGQHIYGDITGEQLAVAVNHSGIFAAGRKFYPTKGEKEYLRPAAEYTAPERGRARTFKIGDRTFYMGVCYDSFGIRRLNLTNPGVDVFLNLVHWFLPVGRGQSGETYYARHGFAGASKQWEVPVFGCAQFYGRKVPENWPTGVFNKETPTARWKYQDNTVTPSGVQSIETPAGKTLVKLYRGV